MLFVNVKHDGHREVREARFIELEASIYDISWCGLKNEPNPLVHDIKCNFKVEVAGIGILSNFDLRKMDGGLYLNEGDACKENNKIASEWRDAVDLRWAEIHLSDLKLQSDKFSIFDDPGFAFKRLRTVCWYYNGTSATWVRFNTKFRYDFLNDVIVEAKDKDYDKYKLYATREMCEADNKPTIVRFDKKHEDNTVLEKDRRVENAIEIAINTLPTLQKVVDMGRDRIISDYIVKWSEEAEIEYQQLVEENDGQYPYYDFIDEFSKRKLGEVIGRKNAVEWTNVFLSAWGDRMA